MYNLIRFILCIIIFSGILYYITKTQYEKKRWAFLLGSLFSFVLYIILGFVPLENIVAPFASPIDVYEYRNPDAEVQLIVEGGESDYVIGMKDDDFTTVTMLVPKTDKGWKMGTGVELETIYKGFDKNTMIHIYHYKGTDDYYMNIYDWDGAEIDILDSCDSNFTSMERSKDAFIIYYAFISEYSEKYWITVNGERIELNDNN